MANLRLPNKRGGRNAAAWIVALSGFVGALRAAGVSERGIILSVALVLLTLIAAAVFPKVDDKMNNMKIRRFANM